MKLTLLVQLGILIPVALLVWLAVFSLSYHTFVLEIPLELTNLKSDLAVADNPTSINATVRAKNIAYYHLRTSSAAQAKADLGFVQQVGNYNVKPQLTFDLHDVWLVNYTPDILSVRVVPSVSTTALIEADIQGFLANGYALGEVVLSPTKVAMIGPFDLISASPQVRLIIDVSGRKKSFVTQGIPEVYDSAGHKITNVRFNPTQINVSVMVEKGDIFKTVGLSPSFTGSLPAGYWISEIIFDPPAVTLKSGINKLEAISNIKTTSINLAGKTTDFSDQVGLEIPNDVILVGTNLINVTIKINVSSFNRKLILVPRNTNITPGLKVLSMNPTTVSVVLSGPSEIINTVSNSNVVLNLDLRKATSGDNNITLDQSMFQLPEKISLLSFDPPTLQVNLTKTR